MELKFKKQAAALLAILMAVLFIPVNSYAASDQADDIKYTVDAGDDLDFDEDDFINASEDIIDEDESLDYVEFTDLPSSSKGVLYYDDDEVDEGDDIDSDELDDITFTADDDYTGTFSIYYTGYDTDGNDFDGEIKITVKDSSGDADDITYSVASNRTVDFDAGDFDDASQDANDEDLDYIKITALPSSSKGILYVNYDDGDYDSKVTTSKSYYYDDDPAIDDITFVPDEDYSGTVSISYKGYDTAGDTFTGIIKITVKDGGSSSSGDIKYSVDADDELQFDEDDFNDYCQDENDEDLDYITFELPSSSKGTLYYDYDGDDEEKIKSSTEYYYDDDPSIDDITFVPNDNFSGNVSIDFEGEDMDGDSIKGTLTIAVANDDMVADDIYFSGIAGSPVTMFDDYFDKQCKELLDNSLDYVKFTLPSSGSGTLYYNYTSASDSSKVTASTKYYYDDKAPYLDKVSFVSAGTTAGTYVVKYTGYDTDGGTFSGDIRITVTAKTNTGNGSLYFGDVKDSYSWAIIYVDTLYSTGVISGETASDGTKRFNPGTAITRGDFMLYLSKALNLSSANATSNFSDVPVGSYYYDAIAVSKALGIAQGSNGKFYPNSTITREDAMVLALRAMNISGNAVGAGETSYLNNFTDSAAVSSYAKEGVAALIKAGIINGSDGKINPKSTITRAESTAMLYRIKY